MRKTLPVGGFWLVLLCTAGLLALAPARALACDSDTRVNHGFRNELNLDFNDYGLIFEDASNPSCSAAAARALLDKVTATLASGNAYDPVLQRTVAPYQGWLEGAHVALIFSAALELGGQGRLTKALDDKLRQISYFTYLGANCGFDNGYWKYGNACMDDYAVAAPAWAWMAAYEKYRGRSFSLIDLNAKSSISNALSTALSICIYNPALGISIGGRGPCNAPVSDLVTGHAEIVSLNHGYTDGYGNFHAIQNPAYGIGLMTSISSAFLGLDKAGSPASLTPDEKTIAMALLEEGQRKSTSSGSTFKDTCYDFVLSPGNWLTISTNLFCGDKAFRDSNGIAYYPKMFPVYRFYTKYNLGTIKTTVVDRGVLQSAYLFNGWDASFFTDPMAFFGAGRRVVYKTMAEDWHNSHPTLSGVLNDYNPIGYLDVIDSNGCAQGWTCDQDTPTQALRVDFYLEGGQYIQSALANWGSEPAVNSLCGGGSAHRFVSCLPSYTKGQRIYAYGINSAPNGANSLLPGWQCADNPACRW